VTPGEPSLVAGAAGWEEEAAPSPDPAQLAGSAAVRPSGPLQASPAAPSAPGRRTAPPPAGGPRSPAPGGLPVPVGAPCRVGPPLPAEGAGRAQPHGMRRVVAWPLGRPAVEHRRPETPALCQASVAGGGSGRQGACRETPAAPPHSRRRPVVGPAATSPPGPPQLAWSPRPLWGRGRAKASPRSARRPAGWRPPLAHQPPAVPRLRALPSRSARAGAVGTPPGYGDRPAAMPRGAGSARRRRPTRGRQRGGSRRAAPPRSAGPRAGPEAAAGRARCRGCAAAAAAPPDPGFGRSGDPASRPTPRPPPRGPRQPAVRAAWRRRRGRGDRGRASER
jgi:hypothetical protein